MMTKTLIVLAALATLVVLSASARAEIFTFTFDQVGTWDVQGEPPNQICTFTRNEADWTYKPNGSDLEQLVGVSPLGDPRVLQQVTNKTQDVWTDWHVDITNASAVHDIVVYKVGEGTLWTIEPLESGIGFFAHVISSGDPENPMAVHNLEKLYIDFTYDVLLVGEPVSVTQYPTTWYPIPEPSSILAVLAGILGLGSGALRRIKK